MIIALLASLLLWGGKIEEDAWGVALLFSLIEFTLELCALAPLLLGCQ
jgi:hypothetical protein